MKTIYSLPFWEYGNGSSVFKIADTSGHCSEICFIYLIFLSACLISGEVVTAIQSRVLDFSREETECLLLVCAVWIARLGLTSLQDIVTSTKSSRVVSQTNLSLDSNNSWWWSYPIIVVWPDRSAWIYVICSCLPSTCFRQSYQEAWPS